MKKFVSLMLVGLLNVSAFAATDNAQEVLKAVLYSLNQKDLGCLNRVDNQEYAASGLNYTGIFDEGTTVEINESGQPIITFFNTLQNREFTMTVTSNEDLTEVVGLHVVSKVVEVTTELKNVGTLINPVFEEVETRTETVFEDILCE